MRETERVVLNRSIFFNIEDRGGREESCIDNLSTLDHGNGPATAKAIVTAGLT